MEPWASWDIFQIQELKHMPDGGVCTGGKKHQKETAPFSWRDNTSWGSKETTRPMKSCCAAGVEEHSCRSHSWSLNGGTNLNWGMTILRSDTTSFGLLVACIPQRKAGKTPSRDPKIHSRHSLDQASREMVGGGGGWQCCRPRQANQLHRPRMTVRLTTRQECSPVRGFFFSFSGNAHSKSKVSVRPFYKCHQAKLGWEEKKLTNAEIKNTGTYGHHVLFLQPTAFI